MRLTIQLLVNDAYNIMRRFTEIMSLIVQLYIEIT